MYIPRLTKEQESEARAVKRRANKVISPEHNALVKKLNACRHRADKLDLEVRLNNLRLVSGIPVTVAVNGQSIILDYENLLKLDRSLSSDHWRCTAQIIRVLGRSTLVINYQIDERRKGVIEFFGLHPYQTELLPGLPVVEIAQ